MEAAHFIKVGAELAEGPIWIDGALWFVDIKAPAIYRFDPADRALKSWPAPAHVGWVLPSASGGLVAGLKTGPHRFDAETGTFEAIALVDTDLPDNRLNDAATDPQGRIFFGTMDNAETDENGRVYVLDKGTVSETGIAPITITNGPAISPCGTLLYHVDTLARKVLRYTVETDGTLDKGVTFLAFTGDEGHPDGATCDAEGNVWLGFYGGWAARCYAPDGAIRHEVRFPVANITKVAIGGPDGHTGYATSARQGLSAEELAAQPLAGDIFTFPVEVPAARVTPANT